MALDASEKVKSVKAGLTSALHGAHKPKLPGTAAAQTAANARKFFKEKK